jgi:flavin reductase (DIM6/NTAB) family NADH-FMN oxidoreductase RutF
VAVDPADTILPPAEHWNSRIRRIDAPRHVNPADHREFMSCFPTGVSVVTTVGHDGTPWGFTCSSLCSVSLSPPVLSVCMGTWSRTLEATRECGHLAVNLLGVSGLGAAEIFASPEPSQFDRVQWRAAGRAGLPRIEDAIAFAECRVIGTYAVGDHIVVFGEVMSADASMDVPLLYGQRQYAAWPGGSVPGRTARPAGRERQVTEGTR